MPRRQRRSSLRDTGRAAAPRRSPEIALVAAADGTTNALSLASGARFEPLYGPGSASRFAHARPRRAVSIPELEADVDTLDDLERLSLSVGRRTTLVLNRHELVAVHAREGRLPLGRRRRREARARAARRPRTGRADRDRQRRRRRRGARPPRLTRPRLRALRARGPQRRGARLGPSRGDVAGARVGEAVGRRGLVPARRSRPRAASRADAGASRAGSRSRRSPRASSRRPGSRPGSCPRRTTRSERSSSRRRGRSRSRSGSSPGGTRTRSTRWSTRAPTRPAPPRASLEAIEAADVVVRRAEQPVHARSTRSSAVAAIRDALESRRARCVAVSPLIGGRAVKGPLDRMLTRMAGGTSPAHVARCYDGPDRRARDRPRPTRRRTPTSRSSSADTLMTDREAARRLAETVLEAAA